MDSKQDWREGVETLLELLQPFCEMHSLDMLSLSLCSDGSGHLEFEFKHPPEGDELKPRVDYTIGFNCLNMLNLILLHGDPAELAR
jgi:hypothetical protein